MWRLLIVVLFLTLSATGCGDMLDTNPPPTGEGDYGFGTPQELGALLERRDAEVVLADRDRMVSEIMAELTRVVPGSRWEYNRDATSTPCGEFGSTNGQTYISRHFVSDDPVPAPLWDRTSQAIIDIAARYGYTDVVSRTQNAADGEATDLMLRDRDGGVLTFGAVVASSGYVKTGCYLTAEDKRKAREAAPPA